MRKTLMITLGFILIFVTTILAKPEKVSITVKGMTCDECVSKVTKALNKIKGVQSVRVSLKEGLADVEYDASSVSVTDLEAAIASVGYDAGGTKSKNPHKCEEHEKGEKEKADCCSKAKAKSNCCQGKK